MKSSAAFKWLQQLGSEGNSMESPKVEIYTKALCGYCFRAKRLLAAKGVDFKEYDITLGGPKRAEMLERKPDARTVPQIFIDGKAIGGSDDLAALEREGKLDAMLGL
jgi:glutaredoxin 3